MKVFFTRFRFIELNRLRLLFLLLLLDSLRLFI